MSNYYDVLGVEKQCNLSDLRKAYHALARKYHPDKNERGLDEFKKIDRAYRILIDPEKRRLYDLGGVVPEDELNKDFTWADFFEILKQELPTQKAPPIKQNLEITLEDAYNGTVKTVEVTVVVPCSYHYGLLPKNRCSRCGGQTRKVTKGISVEVPKGTLNNQEISLIGEGNYDESSLPGDLIFVVEIKIHEVYNVLGNGNLERTVYISRDEASKGFQKSLPTLETSRYDKRYVTISFYDGLIWDGFRMKVKGEGMPDYFDNLNKGDLFLTFRVDDFLSDNTSTSGQYGDQVILIPIDDVTTKPQLFLLGITRLNILIIFTIAVILLVTFSLLFKFVF